MKNKNIVLSIVMILSIIMLVSCEKSVRESKNSSSEINQNQEIDNNENIKDDANSSKESESSQEDNSQNIVEKIEGRKTEFLERLDNIQKERDAKEESLKYKGGTFEFVADKISLYQSTKNRCYELVNNYMTD